GHDSAGLVVLVSRRADRTFAVHGVPQESTGRWCFGRTRRVRGYNPIALAPTRTPAATPPPTHHQPASSTAAPREGAAASCSRTSRGWLTEGSASSPGPARSGGPASSADEGGSTYSPSVKCNRSNRSRSSPESLLRCQRSRDDARTLSTVWTQGPPSAS